MHPPTQALLEHVLQLFAESETRYEEYVQQRIRLELDPDSFREESVTERGVTLIMTGVWSVSRDFDYGDGPGSCDYRRALRAQLCIAQEPIEPPRQDDDRPRADRTSLLGQFVDNEVLWREPGTSVPHWLARQPMKVPAILRELLERWPWLSLQTDVGQRLG